MSRGTPSSLAGINTLGNDRYLDVETGEEMSGKELIKRMGGVKWGEKDVKKADDKMGPAEALWDNVKDIWRFIGILPKKEKGESGLNFGVKRRGGFAR